MPDDKTKKIPQDAQRIDVNDPGEVRYWTQKFNCTADDLREAVGNVGVMAANVEAEVDRLKTEQIKKLEAQRTKHRSPSMGM